MAANTVPVRSGAMVDAANVCWSPLLPPIGRHAPVLSRLALVTGAWRELAGPQAPVDAVADDSLAGLLKDQQDREALAGLVASGALRLVPYADPELLRIAREREWCVISADQFRDHRREHPWIEAAPDRFLRWTVDDGRTVLVPGRITPVSDESVSRALEKRRFVRELGLHPDNRRDLRVLRRHWRCVAPDCPRAQLWPDRLLDWPLLDDGVAVCVCGAQLEDAGPRELTRGFVVATRDGRDFLRFPVGEGSAVLLGRGSVPHGIDLAAHGGEPPHDIGRLSRRHLYLSVGTTSAGPSVTATDLGSRNRTVLVRRLRRQKLAPGRPVHITEGDRLVLAGVVEIRLSGRRHFSGGEAAGLLDAPGGTSHDAPGVTSYEGAQGEETTTTLGPDRTWGGDTYEQR